jgi:post-segregation antitoxin (ccd killing protein)
MSTTQSTQQSETRIVNGRVFHVTLLATARDTDARYSSRDHVALLHAGRRVDRDAWLDERDPNANLAAWDALSD